MLTADTFPVYDVSTGNIQPKPEPHMKMTSVFASATACVLLASCSYVAEKTAPEKHAATTRAAAALKADELFWDTLHNGAYEQIPQALEAQTAAYLADPTDAVSAAHVGWLHIWRLSERARLSSIPATLTDDAILSRRYFQEAAALNPTDAR